MADDYRSDITTTGRLDVGGSSKGTFETGSDADWFKITLTAGTTYLFRIDGQADGGGTMTDFGTSSLGVYSSTGGYLASGGNSSSAGHGPLLQYTAQTSGTYFVGANSGYYTSGQTYTIKAMLPEADDYAADRSTTGEISAEATVNGAIQLPNDRDWFHFHADAGQVVSFDTGSGAGLLTAIQRYVYNGDGQYLSYLPQQSPFVVSQSGDYYLEVSSAGTLGAYAQTMHVVNDDYSSDDSRTGTLYVSSPASGKLDFVGDTDRFKMDVVAGQVYTLSLSMDTGSTAAPGLSMVDSLGGYHAFYNSSVVNGTMTARFLATSTGTYKLDVGSSYADFSGKAYTLKVVSSEIDDHGGTMASATALALDTAVSGVLQSPDDADMFQIDLATGVTYNFALPQNDGYNIVGRLTDASGMQVGSSSSYKAFSYTPTVAGTYYLTQSPSYSYGFDTKPYSVTVSAAVDDYAANTGTKGKLLVGGSTKGELETGGGDRDWFAVTLNAGGNYWFSVDGSREGAGTLGSNATVKLFDAQGALLGTSDYSYYATSTVLQYQAAVKGSYYVEVSSQNSTGTYKVKAQVAEVDDYGNDAAHAGAIQEGVALKGKLELPTDRDVFKLSAVLNATYELVLTPSTPTADWTYNNAVSVSDGAGGYVAARSVYGSDGKQHLLFDAAHAGDYYLTVTASPGVTGGYTLAANSLGIDDFTANAQTTALLGVAAPVHGVIGVSGDQDWIKVRLEAGRTYVFELQGTQSGGGSLDTSDYSTSMTLLGANGNYVAQANAGTGEPRISYIATATGDYFLNVAASSTKTGSYAVYETLTSADASAPVLVSSSLQGGAVGLAPLQKFALNYNESITLGSGYSLKDANGVNLADSSGQTPFKAVGHTLTIDPHMFLKPGMSYTVDLPDGAVLDLAGNKAAAQSYTFTTVAPVSVGTDGNDYLLGTAKGLTLNGGAGIDTVYYSGSSYNLGIGRDSSGQVTVHDYWSGTSDTLQNVERLLFTDHAVALDIDGTGGQVYRLYQAAFHRAPAASGAGFWISAMDQGASLTAVANQFVQSPEFVKLYGAEPSDKDFVKLLFQNVLHRDPLPAGSDFWTGALHDGASRAAVLAAISESPENVANVAQVIGNGFNYTPYG